LSFAFCLASDFSSVCWYIGKHAAAPGGCTRQRNLRPFSPFSSPSRPLRYTSSTAGGSANRREHFDTHPRPIPYDPVFTQPSPADLDYLNRVAGEWRQVYGPQTEPFGRIIWGLNPGETTIYGISSTPGKAVPPRWLRSP
jgi:hypothetical protein